MLLTKDQSYEDIQQFGSRCAVEVDRHTKQNGSKSQAKKLQVHLFGFFFLVLLFVLLSVISFAVTRDSAAMIVKQAESRRRMQESAEAAAEACELCSETNFTATVDELFATYISTFEYLRQLIGPVSDELETTGADNKAATLTVVQSNLEILWESVGREDIEEFYFYYLVRHFYGSLGAPFYQEEYQEIGELIEQCQQLGSFLNLTCPPMPEDIDQEIAKQNLWNHADNVFSSICTSGAPLPLWSEPDGSGYLLVTNNKSQSLHPVSGSGINMSAPIESLNDYFLHIFWGNEVDPTSLEWKNLVAANPLYSWLMSSLEPSKEGAVCGNGNLTGLNTGNELYDELSTDFAANLTERWCDAETIPNEGNAGTGDYTVQHFAKMWFGLLARSVSEKAKELETNSPYQTCCRDLLVKFGVVSA